MALANIGGSCKRYLAHSPAMGNLSILPSHDEMKRDAKVDWVEGQGDDGAF
jgi:hypothetical protein